MLHQRVSPLAYETVPCRFADVKGPPAITLNNLSLYYGNCMAFSDVTGVFYHATATAIIGPNGGGKSSLLKTLMGLIKPTSGSLVANFSQHRLSYLPQRSEIDRSFPISVFDMVAMGFWAQAGGFKKIGETQRELVAETLKLVGLEKEHHRTLNTLSGGQLQRALFARIWLQDASIILLDEPFNNLDQPTIDDLMHVLLQWQRMGKTIICVLHDLDLVQEIFPQTLLLAKKCLSWGVTRTVMTVKNLEEAYKSSRAWCCSSLEDMGRS